MIAPCTDRESLQSGGIFNRMLTVVQRENGDPAVCDEIFARAILCIGGKPRTLHQLHSSDAAGVDEVVDHLCALVVDVAVDQVNESFVFFRKSYADVMSRGRGPHGLTLPCLFRGPDAQMVTP